MEPTMVVAALESEYNKQREELVRAGVKNEVPLGWLFMEKIVQLPIFLPSPTEAGWNNFLDNSIQKGSAATKVNEPGKENSKEVKGGNGGGTNPEKSEVKQSGDNAKQQPTISKSRAYFAGRQTHWFDKFMNEVMSADDMRDLARTEVMNAADEDEKKAILRASEKVYRIMLKDDDYSIGQFVLSAKEYIDNNPRKIKRYTNMFRFLAMSRFHLEIENKVVQSQLPSDKTISKYVIMCALWPQATEYLRRSDVCHSGMMLEHLEDEAAGIHEKFLSNDNMEDAMEKWNEVIAAQELAANSWVGSAKFLKFIGKGDRISDYKGCGLW